MSVLCEWGHIYTQLRTFRLIKADLCQFYQDLMMNFSTVWKNWERLQEMWFRKPEFEILLIVKQLFSEVMIPEINVNIKQNIVIRLSQLHGQWASSNLFYYIFLFLQIFIFPLITIKLSQKEPLTSEARHSSLAQQVYLLFVFTLSCLSAFAVRTIIWTHCCAKYGLLFKDLRK